MGEGRARSKELSEKYFARQLSEAVLAGRVAYWKRYQSLQTRNGFGLGECDREQE
jgi:hypothetical protein